MALLEAVQLQSNSHSPQWDQSPSLVTTAPSTTPLLSPPPSSRCWGCCCLCPLSCLCCTPWVWPRAVPTTCSQSAQFLGIFCSINLSQAGASRGFLQGGDSITLLSHAVLMARLKAFGGEVCVWVLPEQPRQAGSLCLSAAHLSNSCSQSVPGGSGPARGALLCWEPSGGGTWWEANNWPLDVIPCLSQGLEQALESEFTVKG